MIDYPQFLMTAMLTLAVIINSGAIFFIFPSSLDRIHLNLIPIITDIFQQTYISYVALNWWKCWTCSWLESHIWHFLQNIILSIKFYNKIIRSLLVRTSGHVKVQTKQLASVRLLPLGNQLDHLKLAITTWSIYSSRKHQTIKHLSSVQ